MVIVREIRKRSLLQQLSIVKVGILLGRHRGSSFKYDQVLLHHYRLGAFEVKSWVLELLAVSCNLVKSHDDTFEAIF